jgi:hypothetical protein
VKIAWDLVSDDPLDFSSQGGRFAVIRSDGEDEFNLVDLEAQDGDVGEYPTLFRAFQAADACGLDWPPSPPATQVELADLERFLEAVAAL